MAIYHSGDQVVELSAAQASHTQDKMAIESVIVTGATAGEFQLRIGNTTYSLRTAADVLTRQFIMNRTANEVELVAEPSGGVAYVLLQNKP